MSGMSGKATTFRFFQNDTKGGLPTFAVGADQCHKSCRPQKSRHAITTVCVELCSQLNAINALHSWPVKSPNSDLDLGGIWCSRHITAYEPSPDVNFSTLYILTYNCPIRFRDFINLCQSAKDAACFISYYQSISERIDYDIKQRYAKLLWYFMVV